MFNFFRKNKPGKEIVLAITGMHCSSCALSIDNVLEDVPGVLESSTNYAQAKTVLRVSEDAALDMQLVSERIAELGYTVKGVK